jgi:predicted RND superfamily exporter protein
MTSRRTPAWIAAVFRRRGLLLALAAAVYGVSLLVGGRMVLDRSIENMFVADDPILEPYRRLQRTFGQHEILLAAYADEELRSSAGIERARTLAAELQAVRGVAATVSLADLPGADDFSEEGRGEDFRRVFASYTHNDAGDAAGVICLVERSDTGEPVSRETLSAMRKLVGKRPSGVLVGEPVLLVEAFDMLEADGRRLNRWCTLLMMAVIAACFRSIRWMALPLAVVQLTLGMTYALLAACRLQLSMVSSMLGAIVTVVGVATVVHVMVHYLDLRRDGAGRRKAFLRTLAELWLPVATAVLTDAAGFAALMVSRVGPVQDFGLMSAVGSALVLPATLLAAPGLLWLLDAAGPKSAQGEDSRLAAALDRILAISTRRSGWLVVAGVVMLVGAVAGSMRLEVETDFIRNFRQDSEIARGYDFVENRFGGAGVWDMLVPLPKNPGRGVYGELLDLTTKLASDNPSITKAISVADALAAGVGGPKRFKLVPEIAVRAGLRMLRGRMFDFVEAIYRIDPEDGKTWVRVMLRSPEQLPASDKAELIGRARVAAKTWSPEADVTGYYVLLTRLVESVLRDQWRAFAVAAFLVLIIMGAAMRSVRLTFATLIPNLLPSLVLFGSMGWLGLRINMGAAMIAAVSVGLSVDGSIHYVMHYQRLRREGRSRDAALADAQHSVGRAAVFAALALVVGFATLCTSEFVPTIYFGALVSLSMLGGLVGNVLVLPALIHGLEKA